MKKVSKNVAAILGSDIGRRLIGFLTVAFLARRLGASEFGVISIGFTILSYAIMLTAGGLNAYGAREIAAGAPPSRVNELLGLRLAGAAAGYLLLIVLAFAFLTDPVVARIVLILGVALFAHAFLLEWYFQGREAMGMIGVGRLVSAAVYMLVVVLFVHGPADIYRVAIGALAGDVVAALIMVIVYAQRTNTPLRPTTSGWKGTIRRSFQIGVGSMLGHFAINLPTLVIGAMLTTADAGIYSAAQRMVFFLLMIDRLAGTILLPAATRVHADSPESLARRLNDTMKWIFVAGIPLTLGGTLLGDEIMRIVFGPTFAGAGVLFRILIWYFFLTLVHTIYTSGLLAIREERRYSRAMIAGACVYAVTIVAGTKLYGTIGTVSAVVLSEGVTMFLMRREFHKSIRTSVPAGTTGILIAAAAMCGLLLSVSFSHVLLAVAAGGAVYVAVLFLTRGVTSSEVGELAGRFR